jgi:hypothetical protein
MLLLAATPPLWAADDAALDIADKVDDRSARNTRDWQLWLELAGARLRPRDGSGVADAQRATLELRIDTLPAPDWRFVLADHVDADAPAPEGRRQAVNSLKEAWIGWQPEPDRALDLGRINIRNGAALGYNPTDWFRDGALRGSPVVDPQRLRGSRLGTVAVRGQALWDGGSLTVVAAPKLDSQGGDGTWALDLAATNDRQRGLIALSQRWSDRVNQQALLYGEDGRHPQAGLNTSVLLGDALTAFVEWAGGRGRSVLASATGGAEDAAFRSRVAAGATYTTDDKLSLTVEFHRNGAGLDADTWHALALQSPQSFAAVLDWSRNALEMPTRSAWFVHANWQDWPLTDLDLTALARFNRDDGSRLSWLEVRWHASRRVDLALQWQMLAGADGSEYGTPPQSRWLTGAVKVWF